MRVPSGLDSDCFIAILTDPEAGFEIAAKIGGWYVLEKPGHDAAIVLRPGTRYGYQETSDWIGWSGIGWELFDKLKAKYCPSEIF